MKKISILSGVFLIAITSMLLIANAKAITLTGDVNGDGIVDIFDVNLWAQALGSETGSPTYNPNVDLAVPFGVIDIFDGIIIAQNFGAHL